MLMLRSLAWVGVALALVLILSAMGLYHSSFQKAVQISTDGFFDKSNLWLLIHHYSILASALLVLVFNLAAIPVKVNRLAVTLLSVLLLLLLLNDVALESQCTFCPGIEFRGVGALAHSILNWFVLWIWYWFSLRLQTGIVKTPPKSWLHFSAIGGMLGVLATAIQPNVLSALYELNFLAASNAIHYGLSLAVLIFLAILSIYSSLATQPLPIRVSGICLGVLLMPLLAFALPDVTNKLLQPNYFWAGLSTCFVVLLMLPLMAISFYARYAVLAPEQKLNQPVPSTLEQQAGIIIPKAVAVPDTELYVQPEPASLLLRLKTQLKKTRSGLGNLLASINIGQRKIDADLLEEIESSLIMADIGIDATTDIIKRLTEKTERQQLGDAEALLVALKQELLGMLEHCSQPLVIPKQDKPYVILVVGINGAGKTTTIGKIAKRLQAQGHSVMLAAGDTFRAAAVEQLQVWGQRNNIHVVAQHTGADSASVIYDGVQSATAKGVDVLIADTAGRLHTKSNLMEELKKVKRIMGKLDEAAPHEVLLVLDAGTGQNALSQTKLFNETVNLTGLVLTKLDGTARGGIIFALAKQFGLPIRYIGIGEKIDDLQDFNATTFVDALFVKDE